MRFDVGTERLLNSFPNILAGGGLAQFARGENINNGAQSLRN